MLEKQKRRKNHALHERKRENEVTCVCVCVCVYSHFDSLHLHAPGVGGLVESALHHVGDRLTLRQDVAQVLGAKHVPARELRVAINDGFNALICYSTFPLQRSLIVQPERGGGEQSGRLAVVVDVGDGADRVRHLVVHDGVHVDRH